MVTTLLVFPHGPMAVHPWGPPSSALDERVLFLDICNGRVHVPASDRFSLDPLDDSGVVCPLFMYRALPQS
jgi:hypothetical protein